MFHPMGPDRFLTNILKTVALFTMPARGRNSKNGITGAIDNMHVLGKKIIPLMMGLVMGLASIAYSQSDLTQQGIAFMQAQRFEAAVRLFTQIAKKDPNDFMAIYYRGMAQYYLNNTDAAISDYTQAIKKNPSNADFLTSRGVAYFRKGEYDRAKKDLDTALKIKPDDANAINQKAWMMATCPDPLYRDGKKAVSLAERAVKYKAVPNYMDTLAAAYAETGQFKRAISIQRKVITMLTQEERFDRLDQYLTRLKAYETGQPWRASTKKVMRAQKIEKQPQLNGEAKPPVKKIPDRKIAEKVTDPPKQPATKTVQPKTDHSEKNEFSKKIVASKASQYPYTIFISTYQDPNVSKKKVVKLRNNNDPAYVSHAFFKDSGHWYQIYYGWYPDIESAKKTAESLQKRHFRKAIVVKKPFALQVGVYESKTTLKQTEKRLVNLNYPPYRVKNSQNPKQIRLLIGAYSTATVPDKILATLKSAGFDPIVVKR